MALSDEEKKTLEALTRKANEPDEDDFDIEIWDETGAGAKVPYRKGRSWLQRFGIDLPDVPPATDPKGTKTSSGTGNTDTGSADGTGTAQRYFGSPRSRKAS